MGLESLGYLYAIYNKKVFQIYSEPNYDDYTIELIGYGEIFTVSIFSVELLKNKKDTQ